jgi:hypothetical protein
MCREVMGQVRSILVLEQWHGVSTGDEGQKARHQVASHLHECV